MRRAIRRFVSKLIGRKKYVFFLVIILICLIALCLGIYAQFFYRFQPTDPFMIGINIGSQKTEEELERLRVNFNNLFQNEIKINSDNVKVDKLENKKDIVYIGYNLVNEDENYYTIDAKVPVLNINTDKAKQINNEIKSEFYDKANLIMRQSEQRIIYTVSYAAFVNQDVVSIVVKSLLKEDSQPEKVTVKTYNYSIPGENLVSLTDFIELKKTSKDSVQSTITNRIKTAYNNALIIAAEYGITYERDLNNSMYKVENTKTFFLTDEGYVYIIYPYGNDNYTNEMDIIIF